MTAPAIQDPFARAAFLDGLRGWGSLMVLFHHLLPTFLWPTTPEFRHWTLAFITDGTLAVHVFFVLSGFALSIGFLETGDRRVIASLALRRYPRLALPILAATLLAWILAASGLMHNAAAARANGDGWLGYFYQFDMSFVGALRFSLFDVFFDYDLSRSYNGALWTMPIELAGSFIVFALCMVLREPRWRAAILALAFIVCAATVHGFRAFIIGMAIALFFDTMRHRSHLQGALRLLPWALFGAAIAYSTLSSPEGGALVARRTTATLLAASAIVLAVTLSPGLQRSFANPLSRYLGSISFPLYLVHLPVLCSAGSLIFVVLLDSGTAPLAAKALTLAATATLSLCVAHLFRHIESASIMASRLFARRLQSIFTSSPAKLHP